MGGGNGMCAIFKMCPPSEYEFPTFDMVRSPLHTETRSNVANNYMIWITCPSYQDTYIVANHIHTQLQGYRDYIDSAISLSYDLDDCMITLFIGAECDVYPKFNVAKLPTYSVDRSKCPKPQMTRQLGAQSVDAEHTKGKWVYDPFIAMQHLTGNIYATPVPIIGVGMMPVSLVTLSGASDFIKSALDSEGVVYGCYNNNHSPIKDYIAVKLERIPIDKLKLGDYIVNDDGMAWLVLEGWPKLRSMEDNNEKIGN